MYRSQTLRLHCQTATAAVAQPALMMQPIRQWLLLSLCRVTGPSLSQTSHSSSARGQLDHFVRTVGSDWAEVHSSFQVLKKTATCKGTNAVANSNPARPYTCEQAMCCGQFCHVRDPEVRFIGRAKSFVLRLASQGVHGSASDATHTASMVP
jgi:hypothetical protein